MLRVGARMSADEIETRRQNRACGLKRSRGKAAVRPSRPPPLSSAMLTARREPSIIRDIAYENSQTSVPAPAISSVVVQDALHASPEFSATASVSSTLPLAPTVLFPSAEQIVQREIAASVRTSKTVQRVQPVSSEDASTPITRDDVFNEPSSVLLQSTSTATASSSRVHTDRHTVGGKRNISYLELADQHLSADNVDLRSKYFWIKTTNTITQTKPSNHVRGQ